MSPQTTPRIVAELGRPETPDETAARKAQDSRNHRMRQTVSNLVYALIASVALVVVIVLIVPRDDHPVTRDVDYQVLASQAAGSQPDPLAAPDVPSGWTATDAGLREASNVQYWYVGFLTGSNGYIGLAQGFDGTDRWVSGQLARSRPTGATTIDGQRWVVYDNRSSGVDNGNVDYALTTEAGASTFLVYGTASAAQIRSVASSLGSDIRDDAARTPTPGGGS